MSDPIFPTIYKDSLDIYLEFPTYTLRFPFTEAGLHKALKHIPSINAHPGYTPSAPAVLPKLAPATKRKREKMQFTAEQKAAAAALVRKLGSH